MELTTDLINKTILLVTALITLYTVAIKSSSKAGEDKVGDSHLTIFLEYFFSALSILIMPSILLIFIWLVTLFGQMVSGSSNIDIDVNAPDAEIMYKISEKFWDQNLRQKALKKTIEKALVTGQYDIVVRAAKDLNPTGQADPVLMRAIDALTGMAGKE